MKLPSPLSSVGPVTTDAADGSSRTEDASFAGRLAQAATDSSADPPGSAVSGLLPGGLIPVPSFGRTVGGSRLFDAVAPADLPKTTFYSENAVPMNSVVLNTRKLDVTESDYVAQAALKVNPNVDIVVPTDAKFESIDDPKFKEERSRIARELGVPEANVVPVRADSPDWPQDDFMAGGLGLIKPLDRTGINGQQRTQFGPNHVAFELGLPAAMSPVTAGGGDTHVVSRPDGQQLAYFSGQTIANTARNHGLDPGSSKDQLRAIGIAMRLMNEAGVPMENIMPLGYAPPELADATTPGEVIDRLPKQDSKDITSKINAYFNTVGYPPGHGAGYNMTTGELFEAMPPDKRAEVLGPAYEDELFAKRDAARASGVRNDTYGAVMAQLSPEELRQIHPDARKQLESMRDLPFPRDSFDYHTDVMSFTPDGKNMFVRAEDADDPQLQKQLEHFGFNPVALPSGTVVTPDEAARMRARGQDMRNVHVNPGLEMVTGTYLNYSNMVQGRTPEGRPAILMPTEALDPEQLTENDRKAMEIIQETVPDAVIVPLGGRSALSGRGDFKDGGNVLKDWGAHCLSNVLPYDIVPRQPRDATPPG